MRLYELALYSVLMANTAGPPGCGQEMPVQPTPIYISGKVLGEHTHTESNFLSSSQVRYAFTVVTEQGVKEVRCDTHDCAETLDALISPGLIVKVQLGLIQKVQDSKFTISKGQLKEVDGHELEW